jgi:hypothetical protein
MNINMKWNINEPLIHIIYKIFLAKDYIQWKQVLCVPNAHKIFYQCT